MYNQCMCVCVCARECRREPLKLQMKMWRNFAMAFLAGPQTWSCGVFRRRGHSNMVAEWLWQDVRGTGWANASCYVMLGCVLGTPEAMLLHIHIQAANAMTMYVLK